MINHVVMWKLNDFPTMSEKNAVANDMKARLEGLVGEISQIVDLHVGINIDNPHANYDVVLFSVFSSMQDLADYQVHPAHLAVAKAFKSVVSERACVDYSLA